MLRNTHLRAYHEIGMLTARMVSEWRSRDMRSDPETKARSIIKDAESEAQRISAYIRDAETALKIQAEETSTGIPNKG
jgi:hypothetical protein